MATLRQNGAAGAGEPLSKTESRKSMRSVLSSVTSSVSAHARAATEGSPLAQQSTRGSESGASEGSGRPGLVSRAKNRVKSHRPVAYLSRDASALRAEAKNPSSFKNTQLKGISGVFRLPEAGSIPVPPAALTAEQERKYQAVLKHFREKTEYPTALPDKRNPLKKSEMRPLNDWEKMRMLSRESMLRYLRATKWDVDAAQRRLTDTIAWRREYGVDSISPAEVEAEARCGKETVLGFDKHARPLHYMHPHRNNTDESPRQMRFAVFILEACIDLMPPGVEQLALLINFEHKSRNPTTIANAKLMLYILQNHYVERLGIALCINVPWIFKAFYNAVGPFIDPTTKEKVKFDESIKEEVPLAQLSGDFGGELDNSYQHDSYWPDLVRVVKERREQMLLRFLEKCGGVVGAPEWVIRGGEDESDAAPLQKEAREKLKQLTSPLTLLLGESSAGSQKKEGAASSAAAEQDHTTPTQEKRSDQAQPSLSEEDVKKRLAEAAPAAGVFGMTTAEDGAAGAGPTQDTPTSEEHATPTQEKSEPIAAPALASAAAPAAGTSTGAEAAEKAKMSPLTREQSKVVSDGEVFMTPSSEPNPVPLERHFSTATTVAGAEATPQQDKAEEELHVRTIVEEPVSIDGTASASTPPETPAKTHHRLSIFGSHKRNSTSSSRKEKKDRRTSQDGSPNASRSSSRSHSRSRRSSLASPSGGSPILGARHAKDDSLISHPDPETPQVGQNGAAMRHSASNGSGDGPHSPTHGQGQLKEGFQDFVRGGSHFFKNLKAGVAGVGLHHGHQQHKRSESRSVGTASTIVAHDDAPAAKSGSATEGPRQSTADSQKPTVAVGNGHAHDATTAGEAAAAGAGAAAAAGAAVATSAAAAGHAAKTEGAQAETPKGSKTVKVLYFAGARTAIKKSEEHVELPETPFALAQLTSMLVKKYEKIDTLGDFEKTVKASKWSVDEEMVDVEHAATKMLNGGEEVAVIPPVSGG